MSEGVTSSGPKAALTKAGARFATQGEAAIHNATKHHAARMGFCHWAGKTDTPFFIATDKSVLVMASTPSDRQH